MNVEQFVQLMKQRPYLRNMGKGLLSNRYGISKEDIVKARNIYDFKRVQPRVLLFDIETAPIKAYVWKLWKTDIHIDQIISDWFCIAWSAKWLYSGEIMGEVLTPEEIKEENDARIMKDLWELINVADIIVTHNGNRFDIPRINSRFIINGLSPTKPYFSVDTCQVAKKQFRFSSNKLDALAGYFNIPHKLDTNFELWKRCLNGDIKALKYMLEYNKKDVKILEEIYLKLRPWIKNHPNIGNLESLEEACAICGSTNLTPLFDQHYYTNVGKYNLYRCNECKAISRGRKSVGKRPNLTNVSK